MTNAIKLIQERFKNRQGNPIVTGKHARTQRLCNKRPKVWQGL